MDMDNQNFLSPWIKRFLLEYLINVKNLSRNTQQSYRDTFRLYLPEAAKKNKKPIDQLTVEDLSPEGAKEFLLNIESKRQCSLATRNQRLAAIHAFAQFVGLNSPEHVEWCRQIRAIPIKKGFSVALIKGKGNKLRRCPLWPDTAKELTSLISGREQREHVFLNRRKEPITRFGIHTLVKRHVKKLVVEFPSLKKKRVSPHTIRHTTATHLLHSGVDINTIRAWLGHVSINTTNVYVEVDLEMKAKALACCEVTSKKT